MTRGTFDGVAGRHGHTRNMMLKLGIQPALAQLAQHYLMFLPQATDTQAQGAQVLLKGIQRTLKRKGYVVGVTGRIDGATAQALRSVSGPSWRQKPWIQVVGDVLGAGTVAAAGAGLFPQGEGGGRPSSLDGVLTDFFWSPVGLAAVAATFWYLSRKRR